MIRRGDYGYDAPYFPLIFGLLTVAAGASATISWCLGMIRPARLMTFYFVFFLATTSSFLYTTRRGKFLEWDRIPDQFALRGAKRMRDRENSRKPVRNAGRATLRLRNPELWEW